MQWNEGFEWAPFGVLWIKSLHCLWMTTMNLWSTTDAGYADTKTSKEYVTMSECFAERIWAVFHLFMDVTLFHRFQTVISMAKSKHYNLQTNHRFVLRRFLLSFCPDCQFVCQPNCTWNWRSPQLRSYCVFTENFNKTSLIHFCFHSKCWHF